MFLSRHIARCAAPHVVRSRQLFSTSAGRKSTATVASGLTAILGAAAGLSYLGSEESSVALADEEQRLTSLSKKEFKDFPVLSNKMLSKDTNLITFKLPSEDHTLGLTVASCLSMSAEIDGQNVSRPYTPISRRNQKGVAEFVIKSYPPRTDGKPGGMGNHLRSLKPGDTVKMKGPWKKFSYTANEFEEVGMIAGGTGITPMFQILQEILYNEDDNTKVKLLYANKSIDDILIKERLDQLEMDFPGRFKVTYTVDKAPWWWQMKGETGFVTKGMVGRCIFKPDGKKKRKIFVCGPQPMMNAVSGKKAGRKQGKLGGCLKQAGFTEDDVYKF